MDWSKLLDAPVANICLLAGVVFLLIAIGWTGNRVLGGIQPGKWGRVVSGMIGVILVLFGIVLHVFEPGKLSIEFPQTSGEQPLRLECDSLGNDRSEDGSVFANLEIANRTSRPVTAAWIDYDGKETNDPRLHTEIKPGEDGYFNTYVTHVWLVKARKQCVGLFKVRGPNSVVIIK